MLNETLKKRFDLAVEELGQASELAKPLHRPKLLTCSESMLGTPEGIEYAFQRMGDLVSAGLFVGGPWERPQRLVPTLVAGTLRAGGETTLMEVLSELRMLALATGEITDPELEPEGACAFLEEVTVLNLDLAFPSGSEEERDLPAAVTRKARALFDLILRHVPIEGVKARMSGEVEMIMHQRPIVTQRARTMLDFARRRFELDRDEPADEVLLRYLDAVDGPTLLSGEHQGPAAYVAAFARLEPHEAEAEARALASAMRETGLVSAQHAALVRAVGDRPELLAAALQLSNAGRQQLDEHHALVAEIVEAAIRPATEQAVYGLAELLDAGLLSRDPVRNGLRRLLTLRMDPQVEADVGRSVDSELPAPRVLLADALNVLGQPLGVSQGWSPTCQSARGISLWSQHAPAKLLDMVITVAQSNRLEMRFESETLDSSTLPAGLATEIDQTLDAVSTVLVPHLDRLYNEMMKRASLRTDDPHKWVNPALYGHWIPTGFFSAFDPVTQSIHRYEAFVRTFYMTHHPAYNQGHALAYPSPVGLFITSAGGDLLGFHAVSLLRVAEHDGEARAYFLNPNAEGRQDWGDGVEPTVHGHGERAGESSLPFGHFASRLYAFHYNPTDVGDLARVDDSEVAAVVRAARETWGTSYVWLDAVVG